MNTIKGKPIRILLVEDSPTDAELAKKALKRGSVESIVDHVIDGREAIDYLRNEGDYADAPKPDIVLLDLNMPRMDGRETLKEMKSDDRLAAIPVIVLTTSAEEADILSSYGARANAYIVKPVDLNKFFDVVKDLNHFWFQVAALPPRDE